MPRIGERLVWLTLLLVTADQRPDVITRDSTARDIVAMVDAGDLAALPHRFSAGAEQALSMESLRARASELRATHGPSIRIEPLHEWTAYGASYEVVAEHGSWQLSLELTPDDAIDHLTLQPIVARSQPLGLPVRGEWRVSFGGPTPRSNASHSRVPGQRRAADLVSNHAYGQPILAMAEGTVLVAIDGVFENEIGTPSSTAFGAGNLVFIEHPEGLHALYGHLIPGSLRVQPGDRVERGQILGKCGNSGRSSGPHLHVHGQDRPFNGGETWGIELVFENVWVRRNGKRELVPEYVFQRGDSISQWW